MLRLYITETAPFLIKDNCDRALRLTDGVRRMQVLSMKQENRRAQSLAAGLLLAHAVREYDSAAGEKKGKDGYPAVCKVEAWQLMQMPCKEKGLQDATLHLEKTPAGKPYLVNRPGLYFNLSHSGNYAVCAVSEREVGVDIQEWRKQADSMAGRVFDEKEMEIWRKYSPEAQKTFFYSVWAAKEAYVKCTGDGLAKDFGHLRTDFINGIVTDTKSGEEKRLYEFSDLPGYALCICAGQ